MIRDAALFERFERDVEAILDARARSHARRARALLSDQGGGRRPGRARGRPADDPELRPHDGPRDRDAAAATASCSTARRWRSGWSSRRGVPRRWDSPPLGSPTASRRCCERAGLPTALPDLPRRAYLDALRVDKKRKDEHVRFVALRELGKVEIVPLPPARDRAARHSGSRAMKRRDADGGAEMEVAESLGGYRAPMRSPSRAEEQRRAGDPEAALARPKDRLARAIPHRPRARAAVALALLDLGRDAEARRLLTALIHGADAASESADRIRRPRRRELERAFDDASPEPDAMHDANEVAFEAMRARRAARARGRSGLPVPDAHDGVAARTAGRRATRPARFAETISANERVAPRSGRRQRRRIADPRALARAVATR